MKIPRGLSGLIAAGLLTLPAVVAAQVAVGIKGGVTFADATFDGSLNSDAREGGIGGGFVAIPLAGRTSVQIEALYTMKGFASTGFLFEGASTRIPYLDIPILFRFRLSESRNRVRPLLMAGPYYGFELSCRTQGDIVEVEGSDSCDGRFRERGTADVGFVLGGAVELGVSDGLRLSIDGRYHLGMRNLHWDPDVETARSRGWSVLAGAGLVLGS